MFRFARIFVVLALALSLGAHWMLLQSAAWVGMVVSYSERMAFSEALSKTFDGEHPCSLCKAIHDGKAKEKKHDQQKLKSLSKLDLGILCQTVTFDFTFERVCIPTFDEYADSLQKTPPKPYPRTSSSDSFV